MLYHAAIAVAYYGTGLGRAIDVAAERYVAADIPHGENSQNGAHTGVAVYGGLTRTTRYPGTATAVNKTYDTTGRVTAAYGNILQHVAVVNAGIVIY